MRWILANIVSCLCVIAAFVMAIMNIDGWKWFLFVGVICFVTFETKFKD